MSMSIRERGLGVVLGIILVGCILAAPLWASEALAQGAQAASERQALGQLPRITGTANVSPPRRGRL